jgi:hypothetical protein
MRCRCGGDVVSCCLNCRPGRYTGATQPVLISPRLRRRRQFPGERRPGLGWRSHHEVMVRKGRPRRGGRELDNQEPRKTAEPGSRLPVMRANLSRVTCGVWPAADAGPHASTRAALVYLHDTDDRQRAIATVISDLARPGLGQPSAPSEGASIN